MPPEPTSTPRLTRFELRRRFWHMSPGFLPFILWPIPHKDPISPTLRGILIGLIVVIALRIYVGFRAIARQGRHDDRLPAVAGYALSVLAMFLIFPAHAELGMTVLAVLAFGDGSATLGGLLLGGPKLPWNAGKTWSGLACFVLIGGIFASLIYWGEVGNLEQSGPHVTITQAAICGGLPAVTSALVESIKSRINDNIRVGLCAALTVILAQWLFVGWS